LKFVFNFANAEAATILGKTSVLLQRATNLLPLRWGEMFHLLGALKDAPTLLGRHVVELRQTIVHALLRLRWKITEAGLLFERTLLFCKRKIAVMIHPLPQVLLIRLWTDLFLPLSWTRRACGRPWRLTDFMHRRRLSHNHHRCC